MKVFVQHALSFQYLKRDFGWTTNCSDAMEFGTSLQAMEFCWRYNLSEIQVVLKFEDARYDIVLPASVGENNCQSRRDCL
jgi:hypothetical protein